MAVTKEQVMNASGSELDELVALAQGWEWSETYISWLTKHGEWVGGYHPSTTGSQCMEIMGREKIEVKPKSDGWFAKIDNDSCFASSFGKTPMIAICRCYVISKLEAINASK